MSKWTTGPHLYNSFETFLSQCYTTVQEILCIPRERILASVIDKHFFGVVETTGGE